MGRRRRRRKIVRRVKRRIPDVFECPYCGVRSVSVEFDKKNGYVIVKCGSCGLTAEFENVPVYKPVDFYHMFVDSYYEGKILPPTSGEEEIREEVKG